jgi:hypothetical protein
MSDRYTPEEAARLKAKSAAIGLPESSIELAEAYNLSFRLMDRLLSSIPTKKDYNHLTKLFELKYSVTAADLRSLSLAIEARAKGDETRDSINQLGRRLDELRATHVKTETDTTVVLDSNDCTNWSNINHGFILNPSGVQTVTLMPSGLVGRAILFFKNISAFGSTINPDDVAETIDGAASYALPSQYDFVALYSDGTVWHVINKS